MRRIIAAPFAIFACWSILLQVRADVAVSPPSYSTPAAFAQEVVRLYSSGAGALSPTLPPTPSTPSLMSESRGA